MALPANRSYLAKDMSVRASVPFEFSGEYGGFVFTEEGKRRMRLRVGGTDYLMKAPKVLRRRIVANFRDGQVLRVIGSEERDDFSGVSKWIISDLWPADGQPARQFPANSPIRVCAKKNCWRSGGSELWAFFERESVARGLADTFKLKAVGCLDHCKQAPNIELHGQVFTRCTLADAEAIIERAEAGLRASMPAGSDT